MDEYIQTAAGEILKDAHVLETGGFLFLYIQDRDATIKTVFDALYGHTGELTVHRYGQDQLITGYGTLLGVREEPGVQISATLAK